MFYSCTELAIENMNEVWKGKVFIKELYCRFSICNIYLSSIWLSLLSTPMMDSLLELSTRLEIFHLYFLLSLKSVLGGRNGYYLKGRWYVIDKTTDAMKLADFSYTGINQKQSTMYYVKSVLKCVHWTKNRPRGLFFDFIYKYMHIQHSIIILLDFRSVIMNGPRADLGRDHITLMVMPA